jgi:AcrR family transcriptional regulator
MAEPDVRTRIVKAAVRLLTKGGRDAVSTRAVSAEAGVQAPAIYRQFADMNVLLHAAAREILAGYVRDKTRRAPSADPVEDLRRGWDLHVAFGLENPAAYALLYADVGAAPAKEATEGQSHLTTLVTRVAEAGRLRVAIPLAVKMIHAGGSGVTFTLVATPPEARDPKLSAAVRESILSAILSDESPRRGTGPAAHAIALRAGLNEAAPLSAAERHLMAEWLDRIAAADPSPTKQPKRRSRPK